MFIATLRAFACYNCRCTCSSSSNKLWLLPLGLGHALKMQAVMDVTLQEDMDAEIKSVEGRALDDQPRLHIEFDSRLLEGTTVKVEEIMARLR